MKILVDNLGRVVTIGGNAIGIRYSDDLVISSTWAGSQSDYDAILSKESDKLYLIEGTTGYVKAYLGEAPLYREAKSTIEGTLPLTFVAERGSIISLVRYGKCVQNDTPTPTNPVDIVCNNGVLKVSPNLLPKTTSSATDYFIPQADGSIVSQGTPTKYVAYTYNENYTGLDFTKTYTFGFIGTPINTRLDIYIREANTVLQQSSITINILYTTIDFTDFPTADNIKVVIARNANNETMSGTMYPYIVEGSSPMSTWRPYGTIYTDGTVETINVHRKNLLDNTALKTYSNWSATVAPNGDMPSSNNNKTFTIGKLQAGQTYTISFNLDETIPQYLYFGYYDSEGTASRLAYITTGTTVENRAFTFTAIADVYYCLRLGASSTESNFNNNISKVLTAQLERSSTPTTYEPYYNGGTATTETLLGVGDYKDEQDIISGNVVRNVGVKVLDGSENWIWAATSVWKARMYIPTIELMQSVTPSLLCNMFVAHKWNSPDATQPQISVVSTGESINFTVGWNLNIATLNDWEAWLADQYAAGTPVIVVYPLATPTTEQVTGQQLATKDGSNTISTTSNINNNEAKIKYYG